MKKSLLFATLVLGLFASLATAAQKPLPPLSGQIIWCGVDYSQVRLIGFAEEFKNPEAIEFDSWNKLFVEERIVPIERITLKNVVVDNDGMAAANKNPAGGQIVQAPGAEDTIAASHLTSEKIAAMVKAYDLKNKSGMGVVFIVDRLVKTGKKGQGAEYVVAFDLATRAVISSQRVVGRADGRGPRNYWFRVVKNGEKALKSLH